MNRKYFFVVIFLALTILILGLQFFCQNRAPITKTDTKDIVGDQLVDSLVKVDRVKKIAKITTSSTPTEVTNSTERFLKKSADISQKRVQKVRGRGGIVNFPSIYHNDNLNLELSKFYDKMFIIEGQDLRKWLASNSEKDLILWRETDPTQLKTIENSKTVDNISKIQDWLKEANSKVLQESNRIKAFEMKGKSDVVGNVSNYQRKLDNMNSSYLATLADYKELLYRNELLKFMPENEIFNLQWGKMTKIKALENRQATKLASNPPLSASEKIDFDLSVLKKSDFGVMYLFDIFGDSCSHGDKVYDVVKQMLSYYKLDSIVEKVELRPVNYFSNIEVADSLYYPYYIKKVNPGYDGEKKNLVTGPSIEHINDDETPTNYLQAIYTTAIDAKPDVISSSYIGACGISYVQSSFRRDNHNTNYLAAALNDPPYDVDYRDLSGRDDIKPDYDIIEPIATYIKEMDSAGSIIVGNQIDSNKYMGMYSSSGSKITALGKGNHWGKPDCTRCIDSLNDVGTSFATPEVATKLLIAKAWWRKRDSDCDALEARKRLILASNINENFIGKFASGGNISLNKLLQTDKGYLVKNDDTVISLDSIYPSKIFTTEKEYIRIRASGNNSEISGMYVIGNKVAVVKNEKSPKWVYIETPTDCNITVKRKSDQKIMILSMENFYQEYKQFVILKN